MNIFSTLASKPIGQATIEIFDKGGPVMWPLLICSFIAMTVAIERFLYYFREHNVSRRSESKTEKAIGLAVRGLFSEAEKCAKENSSLEGRLIYTGLMHRDMVLHEALESCAFAELDKFRRGLVILDTIITLAPMLGILGTVTGIITSFDLLSSSNIHNPTTVTRGIAEALITTAAGLIVAMFALVPFNAFMSHIRRVTRRLEQTAHLIEVACARGSLANNNDRTTK